MCDYTVLVATRSTLSPSRQAVTRFTYAGERDPIASRTKDLPILPLHYQSTKQPLNWDLAIQITIRIHGFWIFVFFSYLVFLLLCHRFSSYTLFVN